MSGAEVGSELIYILRIRLIHRGENKVEQQETDRGRQEEMEDKMGRNEEVGGGKK